MTKLVKPGMRWFHCEECDHMWDEHCRDAETLSGSICPRFIKMECEAFWLQSPYDFRHDPEPIEALTVN